MPPASALHGPYRKAKCPPAAPDPGLPLRLASQVPSPGPLAPATCPFPSRTQREFMGGSGPRCSDILLPALSSSSCTLTRPRKAALVTPASGCLPGVAAPHPSQEAPWGQGWRYQMLSEELAQRGERSPGLPAGSPRPSPGEGRSLGAGHGAREPGAVAPSWRSSIGLCPPLGGGREATRPAFATPGCEPRATLRREKLRLTGPLCSQRPAPANGQRRGRGRQQRGLAPRGEPALRRPLVFGLWPHRQPPPPFDIPSERGCGSPDTRRGLLGPLVNGGLAARGQAQPEGDIS